MTESQLSVGSRIGQYEIREFIARGGMAEVYLAFDTELERSIALKIMLPALAGDEQFVERFRREAFTVARLDHPNIVHIYAVGLTPQNKLPYIAMQYIEGGSLEDKLKQLSIRGKLLTTEQALAVTRQIAEALTVAHNAGIIHRDLKPSNVLIRPDGMPVLVDLGIAVVSDLTKLTQTGSLIGTPHYMSPEQVRGQTLDGRSDLYSLGIMLYEMLAGSLPFIDDNPIGILHKQVYETPMPLEKRRLDLPSQVLAVVATCMQKEREQRFQGAWEMAQAIDVALQFAGSGEPVTQTTEVLTHLRDSALISRQEVVHIPTSERSQQRISVWASVTLVILAALIIAFFVFRPQNRGLTTAEGTTESELVGTNVPATVPTATQEQLVVVITNTAAPSATATAGSPILTSTVTPLPTLTIAPTDTAVPIPARSEFTITSIQARNQTGLQIIRGQTILIEYVSGSWRAGPQPTWPFVGPGGDPQVSFNATFPIPDAPIVSLIAGIGNAPPRLIGERMQFQSETDGLLWLGANDDDFSDNQGALIVRISVNPAGSLIAGYQPIPLGAQANASIDFSKPPIGRVNLGGLPFDLSTAVFKSQASAVPFIDAPTQLLLSTDVSQALRLHLLLNAGNGHTSFANQVIGEVVAHCNQSPQLIADLQLGRDVREWHNADNVVSTVINSKLVWSETISDNVTGFIDLLSLDLPVECRNGRLTAIELIDTSSDTVGSLDPALNLVGVTVEYKK